MKIDYASEYGRFHENQKLFPGYTLTRYVDKIAKLVQELNTRSLLDYGCGKGYQYIERRLHMQWGGLLPHCYDIGVRQLTKRPNQKFEGIICTDVLEHIHTDDLTEFLHDVFNFSTQTGNSFVFFGISCAPSKNKALSDGRNVHLTVQPPDWWENTLCAAVKDFRVPVFTEYSDYET